MLLPKYAGMRDEAQLSIFKCVATLKGKKKLCIPAWTGRKLLVAYRGWGPVTQDRPCGSSRETQAKYYVTHHYTPKKLKTGTQKQ